MKTFYLIKPFLPFAFLPVAPGVIQAELEREGILAPAGGEFFSVMLQILFTIGLFVWIAYAMNRRSQAQAFLKMSSLSKKVFHQDRWMTVEQYLAQHHNIVVSHGLTPEECDEWLRESEAYLGIDVPEAREHANRPSRQSQSAAMAD